MKIILFFILSFLFADQIVLTNGKILEGYLVSRSQTHVTFRTNKSNHVIKTEDIALASFNQKYTRIESKHLQVKILTLEKDGKQFVLCSAVHIGNRSYYRKLESILDKNQLVLFEAFGIEYNKDFSTWKIPESRYYAHPAKYESYGEYIHFIAKQLGLDIQLEELQTDKPFWEPSDFSVAMFKFCLHKRNIFNLIQGVQDEIDIDQLKRDEEMGRLFQLVEEHPYNINFKKYVLNRFASDIVNGENAKLNTYLKVILLDRNKQVLQDIYECLLNKDLKRVGVVYGAYHMKDIVEQLKSNGFMFVSETWVNAWDLR